MKRVNELDFYNLGARQLAEKFNTSVVKAIAVVAHLTLRSKSDCYKEFKIGSELYKRYSQKALEEIATALTKESVDDIWENGPMKKGKP